MQFKFDFWLAAVHLDKIELHSLNSDYLSKHGGIMVIIIHCLIDHLLSELIACKDNTRLHDNDDHEK